MTDQIRNLLDPILDSLGLTLWDMEFQKHGPKWLLRIYIDREASGVTLNDCEAVSRDLGALLDVEDIIPHAYTLEVSSPGLDRTLSKPEHFIRFSGNTVKIKTFQPLNGQKVFLENCSAWQAERFRLSSRAATLWKFQLAMWQKPHSRCRSNYSVAKTGIHESPQVEFVNTYSEISTSRKKNCQKEKDL